MKFLLLVVLLLVINLNGYSQIKNNIEKTPQITLSNLIYYADTAFTDHPGNGFLIDIGNEILAVTCKHTLWVNRHKEMKTIDFNGNLKEWEMAVLNDTSQYVILGELINTNSKESIGQLNTDNDYLVFKIRENHSKIKPLKLSLKYIKFGDTVYQTGWTYKIKKSPPECFAAIANKYSGPSLLVDNIIQQNYAGLSGSPVTNKNNELVAIVSSWKYDTETGKWFSALCSTDYLWRILYYYHLNNTRGTKSIDSFNEFLDDYEKKNGNKPEISTFLYSGIFFEDWLKFNNHTYGSKDKFKQWAGFVLNKYGINITPDNYLKRKLIYEEWLENYSSGKMEIKDLENILNKENVSLPDLSCIYEFSLGLSNKGKPEKAIELLQFTDKKIQHMGELYAFLGEAYLKSGNKKPVEEYFLKCLQTYPEYPHAVEGLRNLGK
jgi:hypothetical protein